MRRKTFIQSLRSSSAMKSTFGLLSAAKAWPPKSAEIAKSVRTDFTSLILPRPARHVLARLSARGEQTGTAEELA